MNGKGGNILSQTPISENSTCYQDVVQKMKVTEVILNTKGFNSDVCLQGTEKAQGAISGQGLWND